MNINIISIDNILIYIVTLSLCHFVTWIKTQGAVAKVLMRASLASAMMPASLISDHNNDDHDLDGDDSDDHDFIVFLSIF